MASVDQITATIIGTFLCLYAVGRIKNALSPAQLSVEKDNVLEETIAILVECGFDQREITLRALDVRRKLPSADVNTLVNAVLRQ